MRAIFLILILFPMLTMGQKRFEQYIDFQKSYGADSVQLEIAAKYYCMEKFRKEKIIGTSVQLVGLGIFFYGINDRVNGTYRAQRDFELLTAKVGDNAIAHASELAILNRKAEDIYERNKALVTVGSFVTLTGTAINIFAHRWLRKSFILPAEQGIGVIMRF